MGFAQVRRHHEIGIGRRHGPHECALTVRHALMHPTRRQLVLQLAARHVVVHVL